MNADTTHRGDQPSLVENEPVVIAAVAAAVAAVVGLAIAFGAPITEEQADAVQSAIPPVMVIIFLVARQFTVSKAKVDKQFTPNDEVVESVLSGVVIAGPASELTTGTPIRDLGSLDIHELSEQDIKEPGYTKGDPGQGLEQP